MSGIREGPKLEEPYHKGHYATYEEASRNIPSDTWDHLPAIAPEQTLADIDQHKKVLAWNERLLAIALARVANLRNVNIVNFGGSFGEHVVTFLKIANGLPYTWTVIEIPSIADAGRRRIRYAPLHFETEIERAPPAPDLILASGSIQYLADPPRMLARFAMTKPQFVFLDRVPIVNAEKDFLTVQHVPGRFFADNKARSVPVWWFARDKFIKTIGKRFQIEWTALTGEHRMMGGQTSAGEAMMLRPKTSAAEMMPL